MIKKNLLLGFLFLFVVQVSIGQVKWKLDKAHSNVQFSVEHNGISFVDGFFQDISGEITSKGIRDFEDATFNVIIDANTINTRIEQRDNHLRSDDFFDVENHPTITLQNAKLHKKYGNKYYLEGDLTVKDVTKTVIFDVVKNGQFKDGKSKSHVGFTAMTVIDRFDFNINFDGKLPSGVDAVGKEVKITVNAEFIEQ
ncbi:MAG TPA: YceI family protein [Flavobacteriaceae bacterium]|nr:YceI family protein [Flavobacteriaceae bacterium]